MLHGDLSGSSVGICVTWSCSTAACLNLQPRPGEGGRSAEGSGLARSASVHSEIEPAERLLKSEEGLAMTPKTRQARHTTPREVCGELPVSLRSPCLSGPGCLIN